MKTIQKSIAVLAFTFLTATSFGQLNLGVQSATQAAVNATAIARTASNLVTITNTTLQSGVARAIDVSSKLTNAVQTKTDQALTSVSETADNTLKNASGNATLDLSANASANQQAAGGSASANSNEPSGTDGNLKVNGSGAAEKTIKGSANTSASATSSATVSKH